MVSPMRKDGEGWLLDIDLSEGSRASALFLY